MSDTHPLASPHPASSLYFALRKAPSRTKTPLRALYTLHKKWREAAVYKDPHQAVTTLNWWHHELDKAQAGDISHPAIFALKPWLSDERFFQALQGLLHGHMHWHHLTRIDSLAQLEPIIDAIGGNFITAWQLIHGEYAPAFAQPAGRTLWWTDQIRHIGHNLTPSRMWLPMDWLRELNLPVNLLLNKSIKADQRAQHGHALTTFLITHTQAEQTQITGNTQIRSLNTLLILRQNLLTELQSQPQELWAGLVTISPRRKWWTALTQRP
jgi:phytoene synthase